MTSIFFYHFLKNEQLIKKLDIPVVLLGSKSDSICFDISRKLKKDCIFTLLSNKLSR